MEGGVNVYVNECVCVCMCMYVIVSVCLSNTSLYKMNCKY